MLTAKLSADKKKLVIEIDANVTNPGPSASGKTLVVASSHGNKDTGLDIGNGRTLIVGLNAYVYAN
jgi:hypothetical protein